MTEIRRVGVLGCGMMGSGIAQVAAAAGHETIVRDVSQQIWDRARGGIEKSLAKFVEKGKLAAADRDAALKRLTFTTATGDLKGCDIVVEAITEDLELKNALWKELDAIRAVEHGVGTVPDIDKAMQLGCGYPMGPLTLLDFVGLDTTYRIAEIMFTEYREQKYAPPPLLKRMVTAGLMGRKSGKGFYDYSADPPRVVDLGI